MFAHEQIFFAEQHLTWDLFVCSVCWCMTPSILITFWRNNDTRSLLWYAAYMAAFVVSKVRFDQMSTLARRAVFVSFFVLFLTVASRNKCNSMPIKKASQDAWHMTGHQIMASMHYLQGFPVVLITRHSGLYFRQRTAVALTMRLMEMCIGNAFMSYWMDSSNKAVFSEWKTVACIFGNSWMSAGLWCECIGQSCCDVCTHV